MTFKCIHCEDKYLEIADGEKLVLRGICFSCTRSRLGDYVAGQGRSYRSAAETKDRLDRLLGIKQIGKSE